MEHRYTIEVSDREICIDGILSIEEMFDWLNYFDKKGFNSVEVDYSEGSLRLHKYSIEEIDQKNKEQEDSFFEKLYNSEKDEVIKLQNKVKDLENLIKDLMNQVISNQEKTE